MSNIWINHELIPKNDAKLSVFDHGLLHGDGVREGMRLIAGQVILLQQHLEQFVQSAAEQRLMIPYTLAQLQQIIQQAIQANQRENGYVQLLLTRGPGTLALDPRKCEPSLIVVVDEVGLYPRELVQAGLKVGCLQVNEPLPRTGTLSRGGLVPLRVRALEAGYCEALLFGPELLSAIEAVPFLRVGDTWLTPKPSGRCVDPVYRSWAMRELGTVREADFRLDDLNLVTEAFLACAAAGITPIVQIEQFPLQLGETTRRLQRLLPSQSDITND